MLRRNKIFNRDIILEKLLTAGETSAEILLGLSLEFFDFAKAMMLSPQTAQRMLRKQTRPHPIKIDIKSKIAFRAMLSKLKKENLIFKNFNGNIAITKRGEEYFQLKQTRPSRSKHYTTETSPQSDIILVIFDIPEEQRNKRDWLRFQLKCLDFNVLQKSVWWGTAGLPKEFIKDLKKYDLLPYIHIFSVKDEGTISSIIQND